MNTEPSPRPWRCECGPTVNSVIAANGAVVVPHTGYAANAALIVDAVNEREWANEEIHRLLVEKDDMFDEAVKIRKERDRFRDIVRRLADALQGIMDAADGKGEGVLDEALLREAREAIGEDAK